MDGGPDRADPVSLRVGRVLRAHGIAGDVLVEALTDFPDRWSVGSRLSIEGEPATVARSQPRDGLWLVRFEEIGDRSAAERLAGRYLTVPLESARPLPAGHYYHFQLIGLAVIDLPSGRTLGRVSEVLICPANDVLRVTGGSEEVLVPMVRAVVRAVRPDAGRIEVDLPPPVVA